MKHVLGKTEMEMQALIERALQAQWNKCEDALKCQIDALRDFFVGVLEQKQNQKVDAMDEKIRKTSKKLEASVCTCVAKPKCDNDEWKTGEVPLANFQPIMPNLTNGIDKLESRVNQKVTADKKPRAIEDTAQGRQRGDPVLLFKNLRSRTVELTERHSMACIQRPCTLKSFVASPIFSALSFSAIFANAIYVGFQVNQSMTNEFERFQGRSQHPVDKVGDHFFMSFFIMELVMRLVAEKWDWLLGKEKFWNLFDALVILVQAVSNISVFRMLRVLRLVRLLKLVRRILVLESLRVMLGGIVNCIVPLFWATVLLLLIMYAFGVFFMYCIVGYLQEEAHVSDTELLDGLDEKFGTVFKAMCILFEGVSGGNDWSELAKELKVIDEGYYICFGLYIVFVTFGVLNIVTGFFVDGAIQATQSRKDEIIQAARERKDAIVEMIGDFFQLIDTDQSGTISQEELETHLFEEKLQEYLSALEMEPTEALSLFKMLEENDAGEVSIEDFTNGCLRTMGTAKNFDMYVCLLQSKRIIELLENAGGNQTPCPIECNQTPSPIEWV